MEEKRDRNKYVKTEIEIYLCLITGNLCTLTNSSFRSVLNHFGSRHMCSPPFSCIGMMINNRWCLIKWQFYQCKATHQTTAWINVFFSCSWGSSRFDNWWGVDMCHSFICVHVESIDWNLNFSHMKFWPQLKINIDERHNRLHIHNSLTHFLINTFVLTQWLCQHCMHKRYYYKWLCCNI